MRRAFPALTALALVALAVFAFLSGGSSRDDTDAAAAPVGASPAEPGSEPAALAAVGAPMLEEGGPEPTQERVRVEGPPTEGADPEPAFERQPEDGVDVLVVNHDTGEPLGRAIVYYLARSDLAEAEMAEMRDTGLDVDALLRRFGRRYRAGRSGRLVVPTPLDGAIVAGGRGDLWALAEFNLGDSEPIRLEVRRDPALRARVVDVRGNPVAGVPVVLRSRGKDALIQTSGEDGSVALPHVSIALPQMARGRDVFVALRIVSAEPVQRKIDPGTFADEVFELVLPPCGSVSVRVVGSDGAPVSQPTVVLLRAMGPPGHEKRALPVILRTEAGIGEFPFVEIGARLLAHAADPRTPVPDERIHDGPTRAGQRVELTLSLARDPTAVVRVLDPEGEPLRSRVIHVAFGERSAGAVTLRTDETGDLRVSLNEVATAGIARRTAELTYHPRGSGDVLGARVDLAGVSAYGDTALGEVRLVPPPLIVAGRVEFEDGKPVARAQVHLQGYEYPAERLTHADGSGRFELRGWFDDALFAIHADHPDYVRGPMTTTTLGTEGLVLRLLAAGAITGRLLVDEGIGHDELLITASLEGEEDSRRPVMSWGEGLGFTLERAVPGSYTVFVAGMQDSESVVEITGVVVRSGETTEDRRLDPIDLRGILHRVELTITDTNGEAINEQIEVTHGPAGGEAWERLWVQGGARPTVSLVSVHAALDLTVRAHGYRSVRMEGVSGRREVRLEPGLAVRLLLGGGPPALGADGFAIGRLVPSINLTGAFVFDADGEAEIVIGEPGTYRFTLVLRSGPRRAAVAGVDVKLEVLDVVGEQVFHIDITRESLGRALEELTRK